ncbi:CFEM domain-containing protein [Mariannaea sp. PMI_226]|nr:CFEM domain-containing protein [Mariannaea sp. PMI_226]
MQQTSVISRGVVGLVLVALLQVHGAFALITANDSTAQIPECAEASTNSGCELTNVTCVCTNAAFQDDAEARILDSCSAKDALVMKNITMTNCGAPIRNTSQPLKVLIITLSVLSWLPLIQRFASKIWDKISLGADDWFVLATACVGLAAMVTEVGYIIPSGLGRDIWTLSPQHIYDFGFYFYITTMFYLMQLITIRLAMLFFYLRIFPSKNTRRILWALIAILCMLGVVFMLVSIIPCWPIDYLWNMWDGEHQGKCLNIHLMGWLTGISTICLSIAILVTPLWELKGLNLKTSKKIGVAAMFILGTFDTIISIIRLRSLITYANDPNPTYNNAEIIKWSTIELNVGIICVCLPSMRLLLAKCFSRFASTAPVYYQHNDPEASNFNSNIIVSGNDTPDLQKPEHGILHTKVFTTTYSEADEEELIPPQPVRQVSTKMDTRKK